MSEFRKSPWQRLTEYLPGKPRFWHIILLLSPYGRYWLHQDENLLNQKIPNIRSKEMGGILLGVAIGLAIGWTWGAPQWWTNLIAKIKSGG